MYQHILLATQLGPDAKEIAEKAINMAKMFSARLTLIHTVETIPGYGHPEMKEIESLVVARARKEIAALGKELHIPEEDQRIEYGSVKSEVLRVAEKLNIDLIIVGSHGRHGLSRLLGSSASAIIHGAKCDVYVIRIT